LFGHFLARLAHFPFEHSAEAQFEPEVQSAPMGKRAVKSAVDLQAEFDGPLMPK
jgi:hypothetical protein